MKKFIDRLRTALIKTGKENQIIDVKFLLHELDEFYSTIKFITDNIPYLFYISETYDDYPTKLNILLDHIPNTSVGTVFKRRLERTKRLTSVREATKIHKIALQLNKIKSKQ